MTHVIVQRFAWPTTQAGRCGHQYRSETSCTWLSSEKMAFLDNTRIRMFEKNLPEFTKKVDPIELLPYLNCLTQSSKEEIENRQRQYNKSQAAMKMYDHLIRMDNWWPQLLDALRQTNQHYLADTLQEMDEVIRPPVTDIQSKFSAVSNHRKLPPDSPHRKLSAARLKVYSGETRYKDLPAHVSSILKIMDSQDVDNNWEAMAAKFNYTIEEVTRLKCNGNETSCTKKLLEDWSQREDATLHNLLIALHELERFDLLERVQKVTGYSLAQMKARLECDFHGPVALLSTESMFNKKDTVIHAKECMLRTNRKRDCCITTSQSNTLTNGHDKQTGQSNEVVLPPIRQGPDNVKLPSECSMSYDRVGNVDNIPQSVPRRRRQSGDGLDPTETFGDCCASGNNKNNKSNGAHGLNINSLSHQKTVKDKVIDKLPFVGISVLGLGAAMALVKLR
ncbi:uncharacterized protein LOC132555450 [Ylistrum balloti]|uniref:uncharacterized protein LOC132555450 n=1 Tax=Ylistrum balloti TaxID=509963 RepID=UPI0029058A98|nr:uncharacterized protein LOC132555450 [Ylistrum balloti]